MPYYPIVQPELPKADNTAASIISNNATTGVSILARAALANQQAQLEHEQMLQTADMAAKKLQVDREAIAQKSDYENRMIDEYYKPLVAAKATADAKGAAKQLAINTAYNEYQSKISDLDQNAKKVADDLKLNDPNFQAKYPVEYADAYKTFEDKLGHAVVGIAPEMLKQYKSKMDQQTVPYIEGGVYLPPGIVADPKTGIYGFSPGGLQDKTGSKKDVPVWQIAEKYKNADDFGREAIIQGLIAAGGGHAQ